MPFNMTTLPELFLLRRYVDHVYDLTFPLGESRLAFSLVWGFFFFFAAVLIGYLNGIEARKVL